MATRVFINNQLPDGSSPPPHLSIEDADFIPSVGETLKTDEGTFVVTNREFTYVLNGKHGVWITVTQKR